MWFYPSIRVFNRTFKEIRPIVEKGKDAHLPKLFSKLKPPEYPFSFPNAAFNTPSSHFKALRGFKMIKSVCICSGDKHKRIINRLIIKKSILYMFRWQIQMDNQPTHCSLGGRCQKSNKGLQARQNVRAHCYSLRYVRLSILKTNIFGQFDFGHLIFGQKLGRWSPI